DDLHAPAPLRRVARPRNRRGV
ncbi:MAG: hypothetical protein AVDCRST_MAG40-2954, partial [uncultured Gemmatimonadaceae bacterium]